MPTFRNEVKQVNTLQANNLTKPEFKNINKLSMPGEGLPRYIHFNADQSGCGFWRMIWPATELLAYNRAVVMTMYQMILDPNFYRTIDVVRLQRQCTDSQYKFVKHLRNVSNELKKTTGKGFKIIWEVDDLVCPVDDIPNYNRCKEAFTDQQIQDNVKRIVHLCDEMTCVSKRMSEHYKEHLSYDKISVIPNYLPKNWIANHYNPEKIMENYSKYKSKPRIGYAGSGTHFDVANRNGQVDDFSHVIEFVEKNLDNYDFYFIGGHPLRLRHHVQSGKIKFHPWSNILDYPKMMEEFELQVMIAPLHRNNFSESKSNIKMLEAGAMGIPCICQNLPCYEDALYKFNTGDELFDLIKTITSDEQLYKVASTRSRELVERFWMKDHLDEYLLVYNTPYGDESRKNNETFLKNNENQFKVRDIPKIYV